MKFSVCCMLGFIYYQLIINILQSPIRSIEVLLFPKKLVFRVGKKAVANRQALLQFWIAGQLVRIANVLGCVRWLSFIFRLKIESIFFLLNAYSQLLYLLKVKSYALICFCILLIILINHL